MFTIYIDLYYAHTIQSYFKHMYGLLVLVFGANPGHAPLKYRCLMKVNKRIRDINLNWHNSTYVGSYILTTIWHWNQSQKFHSCFFDMFILNRLESYKEHVFNKDEREVCSHATNSISLQKNSILTFMSRQLQNFIYCYGRVHCSI